MVLSTFHGYATQFDYESKTWMHLSEEICFIELAAPLKIILYNGDRVHFLNIQLHSSFQYQKQTQSSVMLNTSTNTNAQTYGFGFSDEREADAFEKGLTRLKENKELPPQYFGNPAENNFQSSMINSRNQPERSISNQFQTMQLGNLYQTVQCQTDNLIREQFQTSHGPTNSNFSNPFQTMQPRKTHQTINPFHTVPPGSPHNIRNLFQTTQPTLDRKISNPIPNVYTSSYEETNNIPNPIQTSPKPKAMFQNFISNFNQQEYKWDDRNQGYGPNGKLNDFMNVHGANDSLPEEENLCVVLSDAIAGGNEELAHEMVEKLAEKMTKITFARLRQKRSDFNIIIQIEDKDESEEITVTETVDPQTTTIQMLKHQIYHKHGFPIDAQMWIIGKNVAKDDETLSKCGIKSTGTTVYLYLKSCGNQNEKAINLNHRAVQTEEEITMFMSGLYMEMKAREDMAQQFGYVHVEPADNQANLMAAPPTPTRPAPPAPVIVEGWHCPVCTLKNLPTFEGCTACTAPRPDDYQIPPHYIMTDEEVKRVENARQNEELALQLEYQRKTDEAVAAQENFQHILQAMDQRLLPNQEDFDCTICYIDVEKGDGVMLRECLHCFCKECLIATINNSEDPEVHCPYNDGFACPAEITMQEIEELLPGEDYERYLARSVQAAERGAQDSFHCRSSNCIGWCFYEDDVNEFVCPICTKKNCLTCKAIHPDQTCKEYQDDLKIRAENDEAAKKTQEMLQELINRGEAMNCPHCKVILQKKSGCDWMKCSMCRTEICWATKGPRWGPKGNGDITGGCKCGINGRCTPTCGNCH